ncbi:MAG: ATP-binding protein [Hydrogenophaga sp.]|nr:ATP-binding protein [Hydrogenophaga sp.]
MRRYRQIHKITTRTARTESSCSPQPSTSVQAVGCVESSDLLVLDDQSLARRIADISDELLYAIVHQRYNLRRAIVITSNLLVQDLSKYLADVTMATTILDRLIHRCSTLGFEGKSYRLKQSASRIAIAPEQSEFERLC